MHRPHSFGGNHFVKEFVGKLFTRVDVSGDALDNFVFPSEVFEELAWQFDRVPLDAVDAGDLRFGLSGEDVVQRMAEFMESVVTSSCVIVASRPACGAAKLVTR